jgi:hypothetical protein
LPGGRVAWRFQALIFKGAEAVAKVLIYAPKCSASKIPTHLTPIKYSYTPHSREVVTTMPKLSSPKNKTRVQLDLSEREVDRMNAIMEKCGIESRTDMFKDAMALLEWAANEVQQGFKIASFDNDANERRTPLMNSLQNATRKTK